MARFRDKEFRREFCMFAALAVGLLGPCLTALNVSHNLGYWPHGNSPIPTAVQLRSPKTTNEPQGVPPVSGLMQWLLLVLTPGSMITVGVLYYLGRRHVPSSNPEMESKNTSPVVSRLEIAGLSNNVDVAHEQVIYGTATPDIPADDIELRVFAGGMWHSQGKASKRSGDKWQRLCYFGYPDTPAGSKFKLVAIAPKTPLASKIEALPADATRSEVLSVIRSTPAKGASKTVNPTVVPVIGVTLHLSVIEPLDRTPGRRYPRKLRLYFSNDGENIDLGVGKWIPDRVGTQSGEPSACQYELKDHLGKWFGETATKTVASAKWFRLYVGLDSSIDEDKLQQMAKDHALGVLEVPAIVAGANVLLKIRP